MAASSPMMAMSRMTPTLGRHREESLRASSGMRQESATNCAVSQTTPRDVR